MDNLFIAVHNISYYSIVDFWGGGILASPSHTQGLQPLSHRFKGSISDHLEGNHELTELSTFSHEQFIS